MSRLQVLLALDVAFGKGHLEFGFKPLAFFFRCALRLFTVLLRFHLKPFDLFLGLLSNRLLDSLALNSDVFDSLLFLVMDFLFELFNVCLLLSLVEGAELLVSILTRCQGLRGLEPFLQVALLESSLRFNLLLLKGLPGYPLSLALRAVRV